MAKQAAPKKPLTKTELFTNIAAATEVPKKQVAAVLEAWLLNNPVIRAWGVRRATSDGARADRNEERCGISCKGVQWLCLLGRLPHKVGQGENFMRFAYAILKVLPERYAQLPAGLLQADKGVAATSP